METICSDNGNSVWKYNNTENAYYRYFPDGSHRRILGQFIPDPDELLKKKMENMAHAGVIGDPNSLKSSPAVYLIFQHQKKVRGVK